MIPVYIITLFAIVISITFVNAQNTVNKKLDEVVVSSNRASSTENTSNVQIISLEEIQNAPVQTIEDLLEYVINVDVRQRGGQGEAEPGRTATASPAPPLLLWRTPWLRNKILEGGGPAGEKVR